MKVERGLNSCILCTQTENLLLGYEYVRIAVNLCYETDKFNTLLETTNMCAKCIGRVQQLHDFNVLINARDAASSSDEKEDQNKCNLCRQVFSAYELLPEDMDHVLMNLLKNSKWDKYNELNQKIRSCFSCQNFLFLYAHIEKTLKESLQLFEISLTNCKVKLLEDDKVIGLELFDSIDTKTNLQINPLSTTVITQVSSNRKRLQNPANDTAQNSKRPRRSTISYQSHAKHDINDNITPKKKRESRKSVAEIRINLPTNDDDVELVPAVQPKKKISRKIIAVSLNKKRKSLKSVKKTSLPATNDDQRIQEETEINDEILVIDSESPKKKRGRKSIADKSNLLTTNDQRIQEETDINNDILHIDPVSPKKKRGRKSAAELKKLIANNDLFHEDIRKDNDDDKLLKKLNIMKCSVVITKLPISNCNEFITHDSSLKQTLSKPQKKIVNKPGKNKSKRSKSKSSPRHIIKLPKTRNKSKSPGNKSHSVPENNNLTAIEKTQNSDNQTCDNELALNISNNATSSNNDEKGSCNILKQSNSTKAEEVLDSKTAFENVMTALNEGSRSMKKMSSSAKTSRSSNRSIPSKILKGIGNLAISEKNSSSPTKNTRSSIETAVNMQSSDTNEITLPGENSTAAQIIERSSKESNALNDLLSSNSFGNFENHVSIEKDASSPIEDLKDSEITEQLNKNESSSSNALKTSDNPDIDKDAASPIQKETSEITKQSSTNDLDNKYNSSNTNDKSKKKTSKHMNNNSASSSKISITSDCNVKVSNSTENMPKISETLVSNDDADKNLEIPDGSLPEILQITEDFIEYSTQDELEESDHNTDVVNSTEIEFLHHNKGSFELAINDDATSSI